MKYILFDKSAVEFLTTTSEFQSMEYLAGRELINCLLDESEFCLFPSNIHLLKNRDGLLFIGPKKESEILVIDLTTCDLLSCESNSPERLLVVLQKMFRGALHFWNRQPFSGAERVNNSKLIIFPFKYNFNSNADNKRLVLEREPKSKRLPQRGICSPVVAYKYNGEDVPAGSVEVIDCSVLDDAGEEYAKNRYQVSFVPSENSILTDNNNQSLLDVDALPLSSNDGFKYYKYDIQYKKLTETQKQVVDFSNTEIPLRIVGAAGTGKTTSMLLRAYRLLKESKEQGKSIRIAFFSHSESTKHELENSFNILDEQKEYIDEQGQQSICFTTLLSYCKEFRNIKDIQVADNDASDAKEYQLLQIEEIYRNYSKDNYRIFKPYLSEDLKSLLDNSNNIIIAGMLQHEFSIQIKGKSDGIFEQYRDLPSIQNGLPVTSDHKYKDKEYVYKIYLKYQNQLEAESVYDLDDIVIEALLALNAPIWRRTRSIKGFDYIFVDEMHLFNQNEQFAFHYLTKNLNQEKIPICFALDYGQAIGDRGDTTHSYIETTLSQDATFEYTTVQRSSAQIMELCSSIVASGTLLFQAAYINPYMDKSTSGFDYQKELLSQTPSLIMCENEESMLNFVKDEYHSILRDLTCKPYNIAIVSFDEKYLTKDFCSRLSESLSKEVVFINGKYSTTIFDKERSGPILTSPYNVNGLEFDAVILLGVDGKRVPPTEGVSDIALNYLKYKAYNMLYLVCSRARYRISMLGNAINGESDCLRYSLEKETLMLRENS